MQSRCYFVNEITSLSDKVNHSFNTPRSPKALESILQDVLIKK